MSHIFFESKNFLMRRCSLADAKDFLLFYSDQEAMKYIGDGTLGGGADIVDAVLKKNIEGYEQTPGLGFFAVVDKSLNQVIGEAGLSVILETGEIEAGYLLRKDYWGKGFATEILASILAYGFGVLDLPEIIAVAHPENIASVRVMEKCGLIFSGHGTYHNRYSIKYLARKDSFIYS